MGIGKPVPSSSTIPKPSGCKSISEYFLLFGLEGAISENCFLERAEGRAVGPGSISYFRFDVAVSCNNTAEVYVLIHSSDVKTVLLVEQNARVLIEIKAFLDCR